MNELLGTSLPVFIGVTLVLMGGAATMTGHALANTWRPQWQAVVYTLGLGLVDRFLIWGLFHGALLSVSGYIIDTLVLLLIALFAYRFTRAHKMISQYPWLYERTGLFTWRERSPG